MIVGQGEFDQKNTLFGNNNMSTISLVNTLILIGAIDMLLGIIAEGGGRISFEFVIFIDGVSIVIFEVFIFGDCHDRFGIHNKSIEGYNVVLY